MRRFFLTSLILVLVPTLLFLPVYSYLIYSSVKEAKDYSGDVEGKWDAFQYYYESERVACNEENHMSISFNGGIITVDGTVLPNVNTDFSWESGTSLKYEHNGKTYVYLLSFDSHNNLKIIVDGTSYIILLRRSGD